MNAPPEAHGEYSRGFGPFGRLILPGRGAAPGSEEPAAAPASRVPAALALAALLGALLVVVSQFTALYHVHSAAGSAVIKTVGTGASHAWAPIPLALVAAVLAYGAYRHRNRAALAGLAALGIATLLIALLGDLPDVRSSGLIGSSAGGYVQASSSPSAGLYMETLGAVVLLVTGGIGLLMLAPRRPPAKAPTGGPSVRAQASGPSA